MKMRIAKIEDVPSIIKLNEKLFAHDGKWDDTLDFGWPRSDEGRSYFEACVSTSTRVAFIIEINETIVGYLCGFIEEASYRILDKIGVLGNMYVEEKYRGQGIGTKLVEQFKLWCQQQGVKRIRVEATAQNSGSVNFYHQLGFTDYSVTLEREI